MQQRGVDLNKIEKEFIQMAFNQYAPAGRA
jgi:hypothetical protein